MTRLANLSQWFKRVIKIDLGHIHCAFNELGLTDLSMAARITIWPIFLVIWGLQLHRIVLYCIVLYCIVLYCIIIYCIVLYCTEEDRVFSPPKGRSRTKKHLMTPSPNDERNKRHKFYSHSSDNESDNDNLIDEELRAKFKKMKGKKNKKVNIDMEKEDFVKQKGKKHKNKK